MRLTAEAQRVLGCLIEKALATPQQYPLSLNALRTACNQSTGRDPVVDYDEATVRAGLTDLRDNQLTRTVYARGSRTPKYEHLLEEALSIGTPELAALAVLLLRGPQTVGEIRTRSDRLHGFTDLDEVDVVLDHLATHHLGPFVERLERQPGQKEPRVRHLLGTEADGPGSAEPTTTASADDDPPEAAPTLQAQIDALRAEVTSLRAEVAELRDQAAEGRPADQLS